VTVHVRAATAADRDFIAGVVPRLRAFGPPALRPTDALDRAERETLERALADPQPDETLLVGELDGEPAGVAYALTGTDYFTREKHGHLSIIAVAESVVNVGAVRVAMRAAWGFVGK